MKKVIKSESGYQYFLVDKEGFIEEVFYSKVKADIEASKMNSANIKALKTLKNKEV